LRIDRKIVSSQGEPAQYTNSNTNYSPFSADCSGPSTLNQSQASSSSIVPVFSSPFPRPSSFPATQIERRSAMSNLRSASNASQNRGQTRTTRDRSDGRSLSPRERRRIAEAAYLRDFRAGVENERRREAEIAQVVGGGEDRDHPDHGDA
jgi:hypothetical protein